MIQYDFEGWRLSDIRDYQLPPQFWVCYLHLRNWLLRNKEFIESVYYPQNSDTQLSRAWGTMDCLFDRIYEEEVEAGRM